MASTIAARPGVAASPACSPAPRALGPLGLRSRVPVASTSYRRTTQINVASVQPSAGDADAGEDLLKVTKEWAKLSYNEQHKRLFANGPENLNIKKPVPKPDWKAQQTDPESKKIWLSEVFSTLKRNLVFGREWNGVDVLYTGFIAALHIGACFAPFCFSMQNFYLFLGTYFLTGCFGITLSFHRQLSHRSFKTPKWLEYFFAYCGVMSVQGDPLEWASTHRYHHLHCETPLDPHSSYEGFWWSHMFWLLDNKATLARVDDRTNVKDMDTPFYRHMQKYYMVHAVGLQFLALYLIGGFPAMVWGGAFRIVWVYHVTWFVNSACHLWGKQAFETRDQSMNNWWVGLLAWGEGWHNNHHAFEFSARHGLEPQQFDLTWIIIQALQKVGLATDVKLPTQKQMEKMAFPGTYFAAPSASA